jgi:hypothetical protein
MEKLPNYIIILEAWAVLKRTMVSIETMFGYKMDARAIFTHVIFQVTTFF